jgi:hypothetical protein
MFSAGGEKVIPLRKHYTYIYIHTHIYIYTYTHTHTQFFVILGFELRTLCLLGRALHLSHTPSPKVLII